MEPKIYFIRHGETDRNLHKIINPGDVDSMLNDTGIKQAHDAGKKLQVENMSFDVIISSALTRAVDTAKIIAEYIGYDGEIIERDDIKEKYAGIFKDYHQSQFPKEFGVNYSQEVLEKFPDQHFEGVESGPDFQKRIDDAMTSIKSNPDYQDKTILLVAHGGIGRSIFGSDVHIGNCELRKI